MKSKVKFYKKVISFFLAVMMINAMGFTGVKASASTIDYYSDSNNGDGNLENVTLTDTSEAQLMVRTGDIDNFGYGWSSSFNPFSGNATPSHGYPFQPSSNDVSYANGTDRIMVTSGYNAWMYPDKMAYEDANGNSVYSSYTGTKVNIENTDGYTKTSNSNSLNNAVGAITMQQFTAPSSVNDATLQLFVDDFQAGKYAENGVIPNHRSKVHYKAYINNRYIPELSDLINQLNQSGPIGKLITFEIPQGDLDLIKSGQISIKIDDATTQNYSDGYAIDFIKLLINKRGTNSNTGTVWGYVKNKAGNPIPKAIVSVNNDSNNCVITGNDGRYELHNVPAGLAVIKASADNYDSQSYTQTVVAGTTYRQDFSLSQTGPKLTLTQAPNATTYTNGAVTITATGTAGTNQVKDIILPDGRTINGSSAEYQVSSNGTYTFEVDDSVGNSDIQTITISNIDTTPPTLTLTQSQTNGTVIITATATDNVAVASITKPDNTVVNGSSTTYTVNANGSYTFKATDTAGNVTTQSINVSNTNNMPQVKIDVTDSSGLLDEYSVDSNNSSNRVDKDVTDKNYTLKGDAYTNFSVNSNNANSFQYSIVKNSGKQTDMPTSGWTNFDLHATDQGNDDVDTSKKGYLTQRAYDVNHMATLTDWTNWSNPAQVFKSPYPELGYKSADTSTTKDAYGYEENVVPYTITDVKGNKITVNSRWHSNTVFMTNMDIFGAYKEASKFWGYITVPQDGNYVFGAASDDGFRGWITVDGTAKQFANMFQPQSVSFGSTNTVLSLKAGKCYPIYLEYFNWGGSAAFQLYYTNNGSIYSNKTAIPKEWFYPSKSASPGEYSQTLFTGNQGVKLPNVPGQYYIAYRTGVGTKSADGSTTIDPTKGGYREGIYGPFVVKPTASLELTKDYDSQNAVTGKYFKINYTITPKDIQVSDFSSNKPQNLEVSNIKFNEVLPSGLTTDNANINPSNNLQVVLNGNNISGNVSQSIQYKLDSTGTKYTADPISFSIWVKSDTASSYSMSGQNSYITYQDIDDGNKTANFNDLSITVSNPTKTKPDKPVITSDPTTTTTDKVTVTIEYSSDSVTKQYRIDDGTTTGDWQSYTGPFEVSKNCTIEAKGIDSAGTESDITRYDINNIVGVPGMPVIDVNPKAFTNDKDTVTITYSDDSTIKQYRINTGTATGEWQTYTGTFNVTDNCTIEAKGTNQYNIESQTARYTVNNIDKIAPSQPAISLNSNNQVLITPGVDNDGGSGVKETEYQIYSGNTPGDNQSWTTYQNSFDPNMQVFTVQAKTIDNAGNESAVVTQTFDIASIIRKHGIYDANSNQNDYINANNKIANGIPANLAMIIDAKAFNPTINLNIGDISKISDDNINNGIDVKEYEISNGTVGSLIKEKNLTIDNSSISISSSDGFVMNSGHEYMIVYTITPKGSSNDTIDMTANVKNTSNSNNLELQIQDMPDLF